MRLSKNFTLAELTKTSTGLPNNPSDVEIERLKILCEKVLQPLRDEFNAPIIVNSGYRSQQVNKAVGGVPTSMHLIGCASDITTGNKEGNKKLFNIIKETLPFDELISYGYRFLHVSYTTERKNRCKIVVK